MYEFEGWLGFGDQFTCLGPGLLSHFGCRVYDEFTSLGLNPKPGLGFRGLGFRGLGFRGLEV